MYSKHRAICLTTNKTIEEIKMFEGVGGSNWFYEHRVGIYLAVSFIISAVIAKHSSQNAEEVSQRLCGLLIAH